MDRIVPIIDMDALREKNAGAIARLREAMISIGFVILTNHRIPSSHIYAMYALLKLLWALPSKTLKRYEIDGGQRGYTPFGKEHAKDSTRPDLKQFWTVGSENGKEPNIWPDEVPALCSIASVLYAKLYDLAIEMLGAIEAVLHYAPGTLVSMVSPDLTLLRMINYPPIEGDPRGALRSWPHEDINLITLLVAATKSGLEVLTRDGKWVSVDEQPGMIVVNTGDMLKMFSGEQLPSTTHRVVNGDETGPRDSMPFFVHPQPSTILDKRTGYTAGEFLQTRLKEIGVLK